MIEQQLRNWLIANTALTSAQIHFTRAIQGTPSPYIVISRITGTWNDTHEGDNGTAEGIWQVSVFVTTVNNPGALTQLKSTNMAVYGLHGATLTGAPRIQQTSEVDLYEQDAAMYHTAHRFLIQYYT